MPRGRPSLQRTKEEARIARRAQVRRNVDAFRQRKRSGDRPEYSHPSPFTFILEQWGQPVSPVLLDTDLDTLPGQLCDLVEDDLGPQAVGHLGKVKSAFQSDPGFHRV